MKNINLNTETFSLDGIKLNKYELYRYKLIISLLIEYWNNINNEEIRKRIYNYFGFIFNKSIYKDLFKKSKKIILNINLNNLIISKFNIYNKILIEQNKLEIFSKESIDELICRIIFLITLFKKLRKKT